jgi:hypothetical protein
VILSGVWQGLAAYPIAGITSHEIQVAPPRCGWGGSVELRSLYDLVATLHSF